MFARCLQFKIYLWLRHASHQERLFEERRIAYGVTKTSAWKGRRIVASYRVVFIKLLKFLHELSSKQYLPRKSETTFIDYVDVGSIILGSAVFLRVIEHIFLIDGFRVNI